MTLGPGKRNVELLLLGACLLLLVCIEGPNINAWLSGPTAPRATPSINVVDRPDFVLYIPAGLPPGGKLPLVVGLSPGGNTQEVIQAWREVAEKYKWIILASKTFHNGIDVTPVFAKIDQEIRAGLGLPIDRKRILATGLSGGGMGSHMLSFHYPDLVSAVVVNTGMIDDYYYSRESTYPRGKLAVFLASPTDFRYGEMKRDHAFLDKLGWNTKWIEFEGGHRIAPPSAYDQAASWLIDQWGGTEVHR